MKPIKILLLIFLLLPALAAFAQTDTLFKGLLTVPFDLGPHKPINQTDAQGLKQGLWMTIITTDTIYGKEITVEKDTIIGNYKDGKEEGEWIRFGNQGASLLHYLHGKKYGKFIHTSRYGIDTSRSTSGYYDNDTLIYVSHPKFPHTVTYLSAGRDTVYQIDYYTDTILRTKKIITNFDMNDYLKWGSSYFRVYHEEYYSWQIKANTNVFVRSSVTDNDEARGIRRVIKYDAYLDQTEDKLMLAPQFDAWTKPVDNDQIWNHYKMNNLRDTLHQYPYITYTVISQQGQKVQTRINTRFDHLNIRDTLFTYRDGNLLSTNVTFGFPEETSYLKEYYASGELRCIMESVRHISKSYHTILTRTCYYESGKVKMRKENDTTYFYRENGKILGFDVVTPNYVLLSSRSYNESGQEVCFTTKRGNRTLKTTTDAAGKKTRTKLWSANRDNSCCKDFYE